ncbi:auxilin-related protein 1-like isoform X2 [Panicum hallii]|nr:auxilin-related protein 1-like isoform X2 [Panicum hallii]
MRQESEPISSSKMSVSMPEDPFIILGGMHKSGYSSFGLFSDHLDNISMPAKSGNTKVDTPGNTSGMFQTSDIFAEFPKAMPSFSSISENKSDTTERGSVDNINSMSHSNQMPQEKPVQLASTEAPDNILPEMNIPEASFIHEVPSTTGFETLNPFAGEDELLEENQSSKMPHDVWLTVSDIALVTQPTSAPPPSHPPPPLATRKSPTESVTSETYVHHRNQGYHHSVGSAKVSKTSQIDELEDFFMAKPFKFANDRPQVLKHEEKEQYSSAATASFMDWSEMEHSTGVNQGAFDSMFTSSQYQQPGLDKKAEFCAHEKETTDEERLDNEQVQREREKEQRRAEREREEELEREREKVRRREQEERKRREQEREARQAVEKAVQEVRERAAAEARMQAEKEARQRAERAAVQKAAAEARERAAVQARERVAKAAAEAKEREAAETRERAAKAAAEARERAAAEAREKAAAESQEKAAAEARAKAERAAVEKAAVEAQRRAERAAFEKVAAEARQRAANEAREKAAAEARARENQQRRATAEPDLESFFGMPSRSSSVPRSQTATMNPFDIQPHGTAGSGDVRRTSSSSSSPFTQPSPSNLMDDLSSIFGAPSSSAVFQEMDGESEERRKGRLDRHQRIMERAAKALAEKNERDLQAQREQEERHRIGESLDFEVKRWAAGKEGNLRALLSTLQYVLWPECGWRPVSLTDLITAAAVKKEYRKATLCIHPDKVQQKGANLQQKYIAEKVFDLLKEAWNKFNSEELF